MNYTKFFNSNPSVSGNNAMSNIEALAKFDTWLAGQEIIDISVGESQDNYTQLIFTKENGETYTVNIPTVKGETGEKLTIKSVELGVVELTPKATTSKYFSDITSDGFIPSNIMFLEYLPFSTTDSNTGNNSIVCCKYSTAGLTSRVVCNYGVNGDGVGVLSLETTPTYTSIHNYTDSAIYAIRLHFLGRYNNDNQSANS